MGNSLRIGSIGGIPIRVHISWFVIAALFGWGQYQQYTSLQGLTSSYALELSSIFVALFFLSIFLHEGAHAAMGRLLDIPVKSITLWAFGGFTEVQADRRGSGAEFLVSAAGPFTSLVIGLVMWGPTWVIGTTGSPLAELIHQIGGWNLILAALNALPGLPLDGGRVLRAIVWKVTGNRTSATRVAARGGQVIGAALIGFGVWQFTRSGTFNGPWLVFIGLFLFQAAGQSARFEERRSALSGATVGDAMSPPPSTIPAAMSLSECLDKYLRGREDQMFPVVEGNRLIGLLTFKSAAGVGMYDPMKPAREAMVPLDQVMVVDSGAPLEEFAGGLVAGGAALVVRDGQLVGTIAGPDVGRYMAARGAGAGGGSAAGGAAAGGAAAGG